MKFRVDYEAVVSGETLSGVETEASWFLVDQCGKMYFHGPMEPIRPIGREYTRCEPLIQLGDEWLSIEQITDRLAELQELRKLCAERPRIKFHRCDSYRPSIPSTAEMAEWNMKIDAEGTKAAWR